MLHVSVSVYAPPPPTHTYTLETQMLKQVGLGVSQLQARPCISPFSPTHSKQSTISATSPEPLPHPSFPPTNNTSTHKHKYT